MNDPLGLFGEEQTNADPLGLFEEPKREATWAESLKQGVAQVGNTADLALSTLAGSAAALFGDKKAALDIEEGMLSRRDTRSKWGSPQETQLSFAQKAANVLNPLSLASAGLSPVETVNVAKQSGESTEAALKAGAVDAAGNLVGMVLPGFKQGSLATRALTGAGANTAQEYVTKKAIQDMMETEQGKASFQVTGEDLALAGLAGGAFAGLAGKGPKKELSGRVDALRQEASAIKQPAPETQKPVTGYKPNDGQDGQMNLFDPEVEGRGVSPYEAFPGDWRVDENGIPIRVDLSLEAQALQNPMQRGLWGDELDLAEAGYTGSDPTKPLSMDQDIPGYPRMSDPVSFKGDIENQRGLMEAIDNMPPEARTQALEQTQLGREMEASGPLEAAKMEAETRAWLEQAKKPETGPLGSKQRKAALARRGWSKKQGGGVLADPFGRTSGPSSKLKDLLEWLPYRIQSLETLPDKERISAEYIAQIQGRQDVPEAEKRIVRSAYTEAVIASEDGVVSATDFVREIEKAIEPFTLYKEETDQYADYGLDNIARRSKETPLEEWSTPDREAYRNAFNQLSQAHEIANVPLASFWSGTITRLLNKYTDNGTEAYTNVWTSGKNIPMESSHFDTPNYVGHTRYFMEDGVRHVVELQSDILQKWKQPKGSSETLDNLQKNWAVRLVREELAQAAKNNEPVVRFATADTVAKVEGWPEHPDRFSDDHPVFSGPGAEKAHVINAQLPRFNPQHQGIYNRYKKEVEKYLLSIGGIPKIDNKGESWIEVPVDASRRRPILFGQRGAVDVDMLLDVTTLGMWRLFNKDPAAMEVSPDGSFIPTNPIAAAVLSNPINTKDDINILTYTQSGAGSVAAKTKNPFVQAAFELVTNAGKRSEKAIREVVFPTEKQLRSLSKQELIDLSAVFKDEMFSGQKYDGELLAKHLSTAQLEAYNNLRNMFTKTLEAQNAARALEGKDPISEAEAYISSRWEGRFRQPVYDSTGKLVWYLAADSKLGLSRQLDALKKQFPDLVADPAKGHVVGSSKTGGDVISMYSKMLDILDRNDPAVADIKKYMEEVVALEAEGALAQTKHFKEKGNIRGFVGDRPGKEGTFKEAVAMFEQQLQYAKNAFTWAELQKVADPIKEIVASPELQNAQPNTVKFIREYTKAAFGLKESSTVKAVENRFSDALGVSPKVLSDAVGNLKSFFILQKLGFNLAYGAANVVQSANVIPYMANLLEQGYIGNPVGAMAKATLKMPALVAYHFSGISKDKVNNAPMSQFTKDMFKYAEDNGVIARSLAEEAPLAGGFSTAKRVGEVAASTMTVPEVMVRSFAFLSYADMLRQSGKFKNSIDIFKKAEELTNLSMVDYRPTERAMMFGKLGVTGDLLSTLQTYSFSYFNQFSHMTREAKEGKPLGLAAMAATNMALAGAMGVPYFNDLEKLYTLWRDKVAGNATYAKLMKSPFFSDPKLWIMENAGEGAVYGWLSDKTGLGLTSRVAAPALSEMVQAPGAPVVEMFNLGAAGLGALSGDKSKMGQAAMAITPPGLQGLLEQAPFMEGVTYSVDKDGNKVFFTSKDLSDKKGSYKRDEADAQKRNWGFRSQKEVLERDLAYRVSNAGNVSRQRSTALVEDIYTASRNGDKERVKELATLYTQLTGKELSEQQIKNQAWEEYSTLMNKNAAKAKSPVELMTLGRALSIMENK